MQAETGISQELEELAGKCLEVVEKIATHTLTSEVHLNFDSVLYQRDSTKIL